MDLRSATTLPLLRKTPHFHVTEHPLVILYCPYLARSSTVRFARRHTCVALWDHKFLSAQFTSSSFWANGRPIDTFAGLFAWGNSLHSLFRLTLNIDLLGKLGAHCDSLERWTLGWQLHAAPGPAIEVRNHASAVKLSHWADREWARLGPLHFTRMACLGRTTSM